MKNRNPILHVTIMFMVGLGLSSASPGPFFVVAVVVFGGAALLGPAESNLVSVRPLLRWAAAAVFFVAAGWGVGHAVHRSQEDGLAQLALFDPPSALVCGGIVSAVLSETDETSDVRIEGAVCRGDQTYATVSIRAFVNEPAVARGDTLVLQGQLDWPPRARNPADPDWRRIERRRGSLAWFRQRTGDPLLFHGRTQGAGRLHTFRAGLRRRIDTYFRDSPARNVVLALILGDSSGIDASLKDSFRRAGMAHILAVSGLHVGVFGAASVLLFAGIGSLLRLPFSGRRALSLGAGLLALLLVLAAVGPRPSVVRAVIMGVVLIVRQVLQRPGFGFRAALSVSALIQLAWAPMQLYDAGFQLSHAAVLGMSFVPAGHGRFSTGFLYSAAAIWSTAPFVSLHFGSVSLAGLFVSVLALPLASLAVPAAAATLLFDVVSPFLATAAAASTILVVQLMTGLASQTSSIAGSFALSGASVPVAWCLSLAAMFLYGRAPRAGPVSLMIAVGVLVFVLLGLRNERVLRITILDVGQGDAAVLKLPGGRIAVIDTGPPRSRAVARHLRKGGTGRIDDLVLTHLHADHIGAAAELAREFTIGRVIVSGPAATRGAAARDFLEAAVRRSAGLPSRIPVSFHAAGDTLAWGSTVRVRVLAPVVGFDAAATRTDSQNRQSLVLSVQHGQNRFLFMGDAEGDGETAATSLFPALLDSRVIKIGHHGSRTSSAPFLVQRAVTTGSWAVVSVGRSNRYGLPDTTVLHRWLNAGAHVFSTARSGAFCVQSDGRTLQTGCQP